MKMTKAHMLRLRKQRIRNLEKGRRRQETKRMLREAGCLPPKIK